MIGVKAMMKAPIPIFKFKPFSKKQRKVLNWWCDSSPVKDMDGIIADGAIRSGKSVSMSLSFVLWAMTRFNGQSFAMCGKTVGSFRRNVLFWLKQMLIGRGFTIEENRSDNLCIISNNTAINYFYIFGGRDERSQDLIQGITLAGIYLDEVVLMPESFVNQATGRCSVDDAKIWVNCNPASPLHWFKTEWIDQAKRKHLLYLHFDMEDNLSLSEKTKDRYKRNFTGIFYERFILGKWILTEGIVYNSIFDEKKHVTEQDFDTLPVYYVSCDYGTQNATVFLLWHKLQDGRWLCEKEYYYSGRKQGKQKTDEEYCDDLIKFLNGIYIKGIIIDPSAASFIEALRRRKIVVIKAKNQVIDGIRFTSSLLSNEQILFRPCCKNTIQEFGLYSWMPNTPDDEVIKENDHCMDAMRYFCYTHLATSKVGTTNIR